MTTSQTAAVCAVDASGQAYHSRWANQFPLPVESSRSVRAELSSPGWRSTKEGRCCPPPPGPGEGRRAWNWWPRGAQDDDGEKVTFETDETDWGYNEDVQYETEAVVRGPLVAFSCVMFELRVQFRRSSPMRGFVVEFVATSNWIALSSSMAVLCK